MEPLKKLTLKCNATGKEVTYTSPEYIAKRIEKAGSLEELIKTYVCREAKSSAKGPKIGRTWNGKEIMSSASAPVDDSVTEYETRRFECKDGSFCTVRAPKPPKPKYAANTNFI